MLQESPSKGGAFLTGLQGAQAGKVAQGPNLRPWRAPGEAFAASAASARAHAAWVILALAVCSPVAALAQTAGTDALQGAAPEALLVAGIRHFEGRTMKEGLSEIERAVAARRDWEPAQKALAAALLRSGDFERAGEEYARLAGQKLAEDIASGRARPSAVRGLVDPEVVFGLAVSRQFEGRLREADRLYNTYAGLVGESSPDAAGAYLRLAEMFGDHAVPWGDADAERAKALAVDPGAESRSLLPSLPDPALIPGAEPYARPIELDPEAQAPPAQGYDSLPALTNWVDPCLSDRAGEEKAEQQPAAGTASLRMLVGADGRPAEVRLPADAEVREPAATVRNAVMEWRFEPARSGGVPVAAWIVVDVPPCGESQAAGADSTAAPPDSVGSVRRGR